MKRHSWSGIALAATAFLVACGGANETATTQTAAINERAVALRGHAIGSTVQSAAIDRRLRQQSGKVDVWVALDQPSLARTRALLSQATGVARVRAQSASGQTRREAAAIVSAMSAQRSALRAQQASVSNQLTSLGATVLGSVSVAHNAIAVTVDAAQLKTIGTLPGVKSVRPVVHYELHLSETVPYIGGAAVQASGVDGTGVRVAVLDSGIDYTHRNLGGTGTAADYAAATANPAVIPAGGLYPSAKVVGGYDFVGSTWSPTAGARTEDPNPIDDGPEGGHGTHVADIIAGKSLDGTHKGVAPGASLLAVKVCSSVSTSCNGVALLKGMDFALDPNGDGDLSDAVDVINMSLGSGYGQIEDDLSGASANAVALGVVVVASAGNSADRPYITGSPAATPGVISVAQTQVPSATAVPLKITAPAAIAGIYTNTATIDWAPIGAGVAGDVVYVGRACTGDTLLASPSGKIALIDRGACAISQKVDNAANAGATGVLLALSAPGDAVTFSLGDGTNFVPTMVIQQSLGNAIKAQLNLAATVTVSLSNANGIPLVGSMVGSSSRGPNVSYGHIKPDIGAPGASLSAEYGTGTGETAFGGTSGAAPMVAGAAALLLSAHPNRSPMEIKAMLMNTANTQVFTNPAVLPGGLAPITRIGAGEVQVQKALDQSVVAWDVDTLGASLSYGALEVDKQTVVSRTLTLKNYGNTAKQFSVAKGFRYADDAASGAVTIQAPTVVNVPANGTATLKVSLLINPTKLPTWSLNGGSLGGNGAALNGPEYDGYVTLTAGSTQISVPWHVLPRKAANTSAAYSASRSASQFTLKNVGADAGDYEMFSLLATSDKITTLPGPGDNFAVVDLKAFGVRLLPAAVYGANYLEFAISTHGRRAHPLYPGGFEVDIDTNGDGVVDYFVFQQEATGFAATGQSLVYVQKVGSSTASAFFYNDADLNSGNVIFTIPLSALGGVSPTATLTFDVFAYDNYFTGSSTDFVGGLKFTPATPRYSAPDNFPFGTVNRSGTLKVPFATQSVGSTQSSEMGVLMMYRRNAGSESQEILLQQAAQ